MLYRLILLFTLFFLPLSIFAVTPNNKFGISLAQPNVDQFSQVKELVNSNGGDWGYITLIIEEKDRNKEKWQEIFNNLRRLHLIPIIRLATSAEGENWRRPEVKDAQKWVDFLDSLNWVTKNRYIILFNEPNHGREWGGEVDAKSYAKVSLEFAKKLKEKNKDFFVMLAGMDASAPSWMPGMEDEEIFLRKMLIDSVSEPFPSGFGSQKVDLHAARNPVSSTPINIFNYIDGWASHSYPNPGFSGSPYASGRGTVRTYEWELGLLKELGINKELPVFITETGWKRGIEGIVADYFQTAYENVWLQDDRVKAVTPFVFDYQGEPFLDFSWRKYNSQEYYQQYYSVKSMVKIKGEPAQIEKGWINFKLPTDLVVQSTYHFKVKLENQGQAVWDKNDGYELGVMGYEEKKTNYLFDDLKDINPFEEKDVYFTLKTNEDLGQKKIKFILQKNNKNILLSDEWNIKILPLPSLKFETWGRGDDYEIQIWDVDDQLVFKKKSLSVKKSLGQLKDIQNIALDELYRVVLLKPYHLPRQEFVVFKKDSNKIKFRPLLPFDFNNDGTFSFKDITSIFKK
ncbi:conserved exported hypothetical protein [Candidatus Roizmanbacteria bacterium]|nr:conserved exported hypothetical protein [Candidatus Roizmanbacteria bacterium]